MNHIQHLTTLLKNYASSCGETPEQKQMFWAYLSGWFPDQETRRIFQERNMKFSGDEKNLYDKSFFELRKDKRTEYLDDRELNDRFWQLVSDVIEENVKFRKPLELKKKIEEFLNDLLKPIMKYKVLFKINNLDTKIEEIVFWDCTLAWYEKQNLFDWGFTEDRNICFDYKRFENCNLIIIDEEGNNTSEIVKRARIKANKKIRILQTYLKLDYTQDIQLLFEVSQEYAVRSEMDNKLVSGGFDHRTSPLIYDSPTFLAKASEKANADYALIKDFPPKIKDQLERTLYWIGLSISESEIDLKITFLCSALETLLTTKNDNRKGEKIAYRGYLLSKEVDPDGFYRQPHMILRIYELRSIIVHGSDFGITIEKDYLNSLRFVKHTFSNFIKFTKEHRLTKQSKIYKTLLESKHIIPLMSWLDNYFDDKSSKSILESIKEDLFKNN
jgi:Apea-like HEPN